LSCDLLLKCVPVGGYSGFLHERPIIGLLRLSSPSKRIQLPLIPPLWCGGITLVLVERCYVLIHLPSDRPLSWKFASSKHSLRFTPRAASPRPRGGSIAHSPWSAGSCRTWRTSSVSLYSRVHGPRSLSPSSAGNFSRKCATF